MIRKSAFFCLYFAFFFFSSSFLSAQNRRLGDYGYPAINNYSPKDYSGHAQTWEMTQSDNGLMYVGTSEGILEYDGNLWNKVKLPNLTGVRSLIASGDRVYCSGSGEFGYLYHDQTGITRFRSLIDLLPSSMDDLLEIFDVEKIGNEVFFRSVNALIIYNEITETIKVIRPQSRFYGTIVVWGQLWIETPEHGMMRYVQGEGENLIPVAGLPKEGFRGLVQWNTEKLIMLYESGFYSFDGQVVEFIDTEFNPGTIRSIDKDFVKLDEENFSLTADRVYVFNSECQLVTSISEADGLADVNLHDSFLDRDGALWVSSNFGLSRISFHIPIRRFDERNGIYDTVNDIIRFGDYLYVSTHTDLYRFNPSEDVQFIDIPGPIGESFALELVNDELWVSTHSGVFASKDGWNFRLISPSRAYKFQQSIYDPDIVFIGSTRGLVIVDLARGESQISYVDQFPYDTRYLNQDSLGNLWIGTMDNRLLKLDFFNKGTREAPHVIEYGTEDGLPNSHIQVNKIQDELIFSSEFGIYDFDGNRFAESKRFPSMPTIVYYLYETSDNMIYVLWGEPPFMGINPFLIDGGERFPAASIPELKTVETTGVWVAYEDRDGSIWFGLSDGVLNFVPRRYNPKDNLLFTNISTVKLNTDSLISQHVHSNPFELDNAIRYIDNSVRFDYSMVSYENEESNQFSYQLVGLDKEWSDWSTDRTKEYVDLREGNYTFRVRGKNVFEQQAQEASFSFTIKPPWYRTAGFIALISIIGITFFVWVVRFFSTRKLIHRVEELELKQKVQDERERISRDLHDSVGTHFAYIISKLDYLYLGWNRKEIGDKKDYLGKVSDFARSGMRMLRETIWALNQSEVETNALKAKIQDYLQLCFASESSRFYFKMTSEVTAVNSSVALNCFRIIQECVSNSLKHAEAKKHTVNFHIEDNDHFELFIIDNGKGFDVKKGQEKEGHYGLTNLESRAKEMGGQLEVESDETGTRISIIKE